MLSIKSKEKLFQHFQIKPLNNTVVEHFTVHKSMEDKKEDTQASTLYCTHKNNKLSQKAL